MSVQVLAVAATGLKTIDVIKDVAKNVLDGDFTLEDVVRVLKAFVSAADAISDGFDGSMPVEAVEDSLRSLQSTIRDDNRTIDLLIDAKPPA